MAKSHVIIGVATWFAAAPMLNLPPTDSMYLGLAVVGSLLPDVDHPQSWVGRRTRPVSTALAATLGHRGVTHSALALFGLMALLLHMGNRQGAVSALAVGYLSHMAADMLTPRGLRLAWPLRKTWGIPLCRTGSPAETLIVAAVVGSIGWYLWHGGVRPGRMLHWRQGSAWGMVQGVVQEVTRPVPACSPPRQAHRSGPPPRG
ncbi:metal-dependent hydrolase [Rhodopila globiformis]|nr:metal-dependent hydrolase [Rhodopila globiformis]